MNFYKHHIGDYAQATAHLSFVEDAAYSRMLRKYYAEEAPLPADVAKVIRLIGARTREEKQAVQTILDEFFALQADGWHNKRADEELAKAGAQAETNRRIAEEREARKRARSVEQPSTNRATNRSDNEHESLNESSASREPSQTPDSRLQTPINLDPPPTPLADASGANGHDLLGDASSHGSRSRRRRKPASDCPASMEIEDELYDWANGKGLNDEDVMRETEEFLSYHRSKGTLLSDWKAGWRTWMLRAVKYRAERRGRA